jgi:hypothetical protein
MATNNNILSYEFATISFGAFCLEVIRFSDGTYGMYMNQLKEELGIYAGDKTGKKYAKPILDKHLTQVSLYHQEFF